jgi:hypothetical protein
MHRYDLSIPRIALGIAAAAMTALSIGVFVVAPASVEAAAHDTELAKSGKATLASIKAASDTAVNLVALHEEESQLVAPCTLSGTPTHTGDSND